MIAEGAAKCLRYLPEYEAVRGTSTLRDALSREPYSARKLAYSPGTPGLLPETGLADSKAA